MTVRITIPCDHCEGHGYFGSADMSSSRTSQCYECFGEGTVEIEDKMINTWWDAMNDYPDAIRIETRGVENVKYVE